MRNDYPPLRSDKALRYLPDTREQIVQTLQSTGFNEKLADAFRRRIAIVKGKR